MKFVFIDDDYSVNYYHQVILEVIEEDVLERKYFQKGKNAIKYLQTVDANNYPDVIFLDLNMPVMDGWEFLEQYQKLNLPETKIVVLTTSKNPNHQIKAKANKMVYDYIQKPIDIEYFYLLLNTTAKKN